MSRPNICVDLDGVVSSWNDGIFFDIGPVLPQAKGFLARLSKIGNVVIWTCRTTSSMYDNERARVLAGQIWSWLRKNGLADYVTEVWAGQGKPYAACYIDDKAIYCDPEKNGTLDYDLALAAASKMRDSSKAHINKDRNNARLR